MPDAPPSEVACPNRLLPFRSSISTKTVADRHEERVSVCLGFAKSVRDCGAVPIQGAVGTPTGAETGREGTKTMAEWIWIVIAIAIVVVVAAVVLELLSLRRTRHLRQQFGPEYERTTQVAGDKRKAEAELSAREKRRDKLDIRQLDPQARDQYARRWRRVQEEFVDSPTGAVARADALVSSVMSDRGYPMDSFERALPTSRSTIRRWSSTTGRRTTSSSRWKTATSRPRKSVWRCSTTGHCSTSCSTRPKNRRSPMDENRDRLTTDDIAHSSTPGAESQAGTETVARTEDSRDEPLLPQSESDRFTTEWRSIQGDFVDRPREAVEQADQLVADLMQRLASQFSETRSSLEQQWEGHEDVSTEELRLALMRYRTFFERLLAA